MRTRTLLALTLLPFCATLPVAQQTMLKKPRGGGVGLGSVHLRNCGAELCHTNTTEWSITKTGPEGVVASGSTVTWVIDVTRGATGPDRIEVNGIFAMRNVGIGPVTVGNVVVNLQKMVGPKWVSVAANCADASQGDAATSCMIVAAGSAEDPLANSVSGAMNYTVAGDVGTFVETPGSGALEFTDALDNTAFSIVPQPILFSSQVVVLLYRATFDNSVLGLAPGTSVRSEVVVSFGNAGGPDGNGAISANIDINGDGGVDVAPLDGLPAGQSGNDDGDEASVRSVASRNIRTLPALEACNDQVTLSDDCATDIAVTGSAATSNCTTDIGGGTGVEVLTTSVQRTLEVTATGMGTITNCAHLSAPSTSVLLEGPLVDTNGDTIPDTPLYSYTFPCCLGIDLLACDSVMLEAGADCSGPGIDDGCFCGYTQGGWGSPPNGGNPGAILSANFASVYPSGVEVGIPGGGGFSMTFGSAAAVGAFLPQGGSPDVLTTDLVDPTSSSAHVFGGQVLTLRLNVDFSAAGITTGFGGPVGDLMLCNTGTSLDGLTVAQVLAAAETVLGGGALPAGFSVSTLNDLVTDLNEAFDNCTTSDWGQTHFCP